MATSHRRQSDVMKLLMSNWNVQLVDESNIGEFIVEFKGPAESPYEGGVWKVHVELPMAYPYKSPSIGFLNRIYHPNVDISAGSVCLDVINQAWSPIFDLINVFEVFLPQLLLDPNPTDPLNAEAASLLLRQPGAYDERVRAYVHLYASDPGIMSGRDTTRSAQDAAGRATTSTGAVAPSAVAGPAAGAAAGVGLGVAAGETAEVDGRLRGDGSGGGGSSNGFLSSSDDEG